MGNDADEVIDAVLKIRTALPNDSEDDIETLLESILDRDEPSYNSSRALFTLSTRIAKIKELIPSATANDLRKFASFPEYIEFFCEHADEIQQVVPGAFDRNFLPPFTGEESQETVEGVLRGAIRGWRALLDHYPEINRVMKLSIPVGDFVDLVFVGRGDEIIISLGTNASKIEEALPDFSATMVMRLAMSWSPENRNRLDSFAPYVMKVKELTPGAQDTKRMMLAFLGDNPRAIETCLKYFPKIKTALPNVGYEQLIELAFSRGYIPILVLGENASKIKEILPSINDQYVLELGRRETNSKLMKLSEKIPRLKDFNVNNPSYEEFSEDKYKAFSEFLFREEGEPLAKKSRNE